MSGANCHQIVPMDKVHIRKGQALSDRKIMVKLCAYWVGERCAVGRRKTGRTSGRGTSENAGISSENYVRIIMVENLRFLGEGSSAQGKSGAKARPKGVVDAHTVDIP